MTVHDVADEKVKIHFSRKLCKIPTRIEILEETFFAIKSTMEFEDRNFLFATTP